jgi:hypothetical protein
MTSQINPNNINGSYPVAGQDNNSQGFRDNFTNIKVNFQDAADEITDLQNKVILKAALDGTTLDNNLSDALLIAAQIQDFAAAKVAISNTSGSISVNYSTGHYQTITTSGNISLSFVFIVIGYCNSIRKRLPLEETIARAHNQGALVGITSPLNEPFFGLNEEQTDAAFLEASQL